MKRILLLLRVLALLPLLAPDASAQVRIYDTIYSADGTQI